MKTVLCGHCNGKGIMDLPNTSFGATLKSVRKMNGWTLRDVEKSTGVSHTYLSQIENNRGYRPGLEIIGKLCKHYGLNIKDLPSGHAGARGDR